jgi:hypothetical protein
VSNIPITIKEVSVNEIITWSLLPKKQKSEIFMPSTVYGAQHLLRLFGK